MRAKSFTSQTLAVLRHREVRRRGRAAAAAAWRLAGAGASRGKGRGGAARRGMVTCGVGQEVTSRLGSAASGPRELPSRACGGLGVCVCVCRGVNFSTVGLLPPSLRTMASDSWALAVDQQEAAVKSVSASAPGERGAGGPRGPGLKSRAAAGGAGQWPAAEAALIRAFCLRPGS